MSISFSFNGLPYTIPSPNDPAGWAQSVNAYLLGIATGASTLNGTNVWTATQTFSAGINSTTSVLGTVTSGVWQGTAIGAGFLPALSSLNGSLNLSQLAQGGATAGQLISWNGTSWVPVTVSNALQVASVAALKALPVGLIPNGQQAQTSGYRAASDGGQGLYIFNSSSSATDNGGSIIAPNSGSGRWLLAIAGEYNVKQFGAYGDQTHDDTAAINAALAAIPFSNANGYGASVYLPAGIYVVSSTINMASTTSGVQRPNRQLRGDGQASLIQCNTAITTVLSVVNASGSALRDFGVYCNNAGITNGIDIECNPQSTEGVDVYNVYVQGGTNSFAVGTSNANDTSSICFTGCRAFGYTGKGWNLGNGTTGNVLCIYMYGCTAGGVTTGQYAVYASGTGFTWYGGNVGENATADFFVAQVGPGCTIQGTRSENSARFYASAGGNSECSTVTIQDCVAVSFTAADGQVIQAGGCRPLTIISSQFYNNASTGGVATRIRGGVSSAAPWYLTCINVGSDNPSPTDFFPPTFGGVAFVKRVGDYVISGGSTAPGTNTDYFDGTIQSGTGLVAPSLTLSGSQTAKTFYAAPNGAAGAPSFRAMLTSDLPAGTGTVTSVAMTVPSDETVTGSPITGSGTFAITRNAQTANTALMGPTTGTSAVPAYRSFVVADIPTLPASQITSGTLASSLLAGAYTGITGVGTLTAGSIPSSLITGLAASATTDTTNAANITSGTLAVARLSGSYTGIAGVGTLTAGAIPFTLLTGTATAAQIPATLNATTFPSLSFTNATKLLDTANGTLAVQTSAGAFGKLLLGAAAATTGMILSASNGVVTVTDGSGNAANGQLTAAFLLATNNFQLTSGLYMSGRQLYGGSAGNLGNILWPSANTGTTTITPASAVPANVPGITVAGSLGYQAFLVNFTGAFTLTASTSGMVIKATGSSAYTLTLPSPAVGLRFKFINLATAAVTITSPSGNIKTTGLTDALSRIMTAYTANGNMTSFTIDCDGTSWFLTEMNGGIT